MESDEKVLITMNLNLEIIQFKAIVINTKYFGIVWIEKEG